MNTRETGDFVAERDPSRCGPETADVSAVELLRELQLEKGGVVVDLGCGLAAAADVIAELDLGYLGVGRAEDELADLADRGFEVLSADLSNPARCLQLVGAHLGERPPGAFVMVDVIERLPNAAEGLRACREFRQCPPYAPLVVSTPNVLHVDLAVQLLLGRWDVTSTRVVDATHVSLYTEQRLLEEMRRSGWMEIGRRDIRSTRSDQSVSGDCVALDPETVLGRLLRQVHEQAAPTSAVSRFVRAYAPIIVPTEPSMLLRDDARRDLALCDSPFLSVVISGEASRSDMVTETVLSLAAQSNQDFEVILTYRDADPGELGAIRRMVETFPYDVRRKVRLVPTRGGDCVRMLNVGALAATGRYLAFLDAGDLVFGRWVEAFHEQVELHPSRVVRTLVAEQEVARTRWEGRPTTVATGAPRIVRREELPVLAHLQPTTTPASSFAIPRSCVRDLGMQFNEILGPLATWDLVLQAVEVCGVSQTDEVTALVRRSDWREGSSGRAADSSTGSILETHLRGRPLLLAGDAIAEVWALVNERDRLRGELAACTAKAQAAQEQLQEQLQEAQAAAARAEARVVELLVSRSWRAASVLRWWHRIGRAGLRRFKHE